MTPTAARPCEPLRGAETDGVYVHENPLQGPQIGSCGFPGTSEPSWSHGDGLQSRHSFGCALVTRAGACDCTTPDRRTTSRGFTYDLGQMLGEGWYDDEDGS